MDTADKDQNELMLLLIQRKHQLKLAGDQGDKRRQFFTHVGQWTSLLVLWMLMFYSEGQTG